MQEAQVDIEKMQKFHQLALESRSRAYCPYSNFAVGSCILGGNGKLYTGCNVQKAVCSLCAQQTAIAKMVEDGCRQIKEVYVVTELTGNQLAAPCGYCRQYIRQFCHDDVIQLRVRNNQKYILEAFQRDTKHLILCPICSQYHLDLTVLENPSLDDCIHIKQYMINCLNKYFLQKSPLLLVNYDDFSNTEQSLPYWIFQRIQSTMQIQSQALVEVKKNPLDNLSPEALKFYQFHGVQMIGSQFPNSLIQSLFLKLTNDQFDGGEFFQIADNEQTQSFELRAKTKIPACGNVFLIDHALTFRYPELRERLKQHPEMLDRLQNMLKYHQEKKLPEENQEENSPQEELQFDNMDLMDISALEFPKNLITLSLVNNRLQNAEQLISKLQYLNLKVLWLNSNPVATDEKMIDYVNNKTRIEIFNSKFTKHCTEWGLKYANYRKVSSAFNVENGRILTLDLDDRNIFAIDPTLIEGFFNLRSISLKGHSPSNPEELSRITKLLEMPSLRYIYVDEDVQSQVRQAAQQKISPEILSRVLINKHSFTRQFQKGDLRLDAVIQKLFRLTGCYRLASSQQLDQSSCWYINDEFGSAISHSDIPKVKVIPFLYAPNFKLDDKVISYSLMWPLSDLEQGDLVTRDYLNGIKQEKLRSHRLAAWYKLPEQKYFSKISEFNTTMLKRSAESVTLLEKFYSQNAIKQKQYMEKIVFSDKVLKVLSDYVFINQNLKHQRFELVDNIDQADIVWVTSALEEEGWKNYKGKYLLNQFPFESCVVMKQNLANTVQSVFGDTKFLMRTYNLQTQLDVFIGEFYQRQKEAQDNLWILKPPNMARSIDMVITDNLPLIIRSMETGPKIAQKYITQPVLRQGKKVDLRYILLVKSISPLTLFLYKNFWIRSANNDYTTDRRHLSTYETQFTVMNYGKVSDFKQIKYQDFIEEFQKDYKVNWSSINDKIKKMLRNVFIAAGEKYPQMHHDNSRAVYGIDIMIDSETMEPKLLQITFSPDCKRACEYYPTFYNDVFHTLFLETMSQNMERII